MTSSTVEPLSHCAVVPSSVNKPTIALTGATGFLGSHLMAALLSNGFRVIVLGRPGKKESLQQRIAKLLAWFSIQPLTNQLEMVEIDLLKPFLGLSQLEYDKLCDSTDQIIHCASDTSFTERKRDIVISSNVISLNGILELASKAHVSFFHYISTAYVTSGNGTVCKEVLSTSTDFINVYEESKSLAEKKVNAFCQQNSIPFTLIRPSIVYGDSRTGRSLKFNALYFPVQSANYIKEIYLNDINNNGGKKSEELGIHIDKEGYLFLPLRIYLKAKGALNLIPINYFVDATLKIVENASPGGIYHLTNNTFTNLEILSEYNEKLMKMKGVEVVYSKSGEIISRNPAEALFNRFIEPYRPYLSDTRFFDRSNTDLITNNLQPPEFNYDIFKICMEYAISVNWGESIF